MDPHKVGPKSALFLPGELIRAGVNGALLKNKYHVSENRGKFGVVFKCVEKSTQREYAAKFIKCRPSQRKVVLNEIDMLNSLHHRLIIDLIASFQVRDNLKICNPFAGWFHLTRRILKFTWSHSGSSTDKVDTHLIIIHPWTPIYTGFHSPSFPFRQRLVRSLVPSEILSLESCLP